MGERMRRQEMNPITGEPMGAPGPSPSVAPSLSSKPSGNLGTGLVPSSGPLDTVLMIGKDVPSKRRDPTKNESKSFHSGVSCLAHEAQELPRMQPSRITESCFGEGLVERSTPTPTFDCGSESSSRRSTPGRSVPGQVVRSNTRPKDNLSGGCCITDKPGEHPLNLPGKAGRAGPGVGSGGNCHIFQGPNGFVPIGPEDMTESAPPRTSGGYSAPRPFQRVCGAAAAMAH
jgi:hypothetical protein